MNRLRTSGGDHPRRKKRPLLVSLRRFRLNVKRVGPSCRKISSFPRRGKGHVTGKWLFKYMIGKLKRKQTLRTEIGQLHSIFLFLWAKIGKKALPSP